MSKRSRFFCRVASNGNTPAGFSGPPGPNKGALDPFLPEKADDVERLKALQRDVHDVFIGVVKERRQPGG